jgi:predicted ATPase
MEERFPETAEARPYLVAYHHTEAGHRDRAVEWWHRAGVQALERSDYTEALGHLRKAIELLSTLPESAERDRLELDLRLRLGAALGVTKGYAAPEFESNYEQAASLCERIHEAKLIFPSLNGRWLSSFCRGDMPISAGRAQQFLRVAEQTNDLDAKAMGYQITGITQLFRGEALIARQSLERAIHLFDPETQQSTIELYGRHSQLSTLGYLSFAIQLLGYPDQAMALLTKAKAEAHTDHFATTAVALLSLCIAAALRHDREALTEPAGDLLRLAQQHGSKYWDLHGRTFVAQVHANEGRWDEALEGIRRCFSGWQARDSGFIRPWLKTMEVELLWHLERYSEALQSSQEAQELIEQKDIRFCEAELHRLRGTVLIALGRPDGEIEACFERAVMTARGQSAKFWELRAGISWSNFLGHCQRRTEARMVLAGVYDWFTEGFDTPDLIEARTLLDTLDA